MDAFLEGGHLEEMVASLQVVADPFPEAASLGSQEEADCSHLNWKLKLRKTNHLPGETHRRGEGWCAWQTRWWEASRRERRHGHACRRDNWCSGSRISLGFCVVHCGGVGSSGGGRGCIVSTHQSFVRFKLTFQFRLADDFVFYFSPLCGWLGY